MAVLPGWNESINAMLILADKHQAISIPLVYFTNGDPYILFSNMVIKMLFCVATR